VLLLQVVVVVVAMVLVVVEQVHSQTYHQVVAELPLPYCNKKKHLYYKIITNQTTSQPTKCIQKSLI
jgi:hypothetical protein